MPLPSNSVRHAKRVIALSTATQRQQESRINFEISLLSGD
jgi:hypothetical protein